MNGNNLLKIDDPIDLSIKILYFAGKLLQEGGNLNWVPGWLDGTLGIDGSALGVISGQQCALHFARNGRNEEIDSLVIPSNLLMCTRKDLHGENGADPCQFLDCPVRQSIIERCGLSDQAVICFPIGKKGFLMACGDGLLKNAFPASQILKAMAHLMASSLETGKSPGKAASYFLPSEEMAQMWSEMLAGLSHDLRTPLACIKGYVTTLLREDVTWNPDNQKEFLCIIAEETDHIENLINNLLDSCTFSWKGEIELKKEQISLPKIVNKVLKDPSYLNKHHQFKVLFPEEFPLVDADPVRIEQVLRNLVDNAVKYSAEKTLIVIKGEFLPGEVVVSVADQGVGISDDDLNLLFEKFFRASDGIREHQKGMGLGLPLVRQVLINHGGRIWAKSKLNKGTTFFFSLPHG